MLSFRPGLEYHNTDHMGPDSARPLNGWILSTSDSATFTVLMTQDVPIHCQISPYEKKWFPVELGVVLCLFVYCCVLFEECSSRWHLWTRLCPAIQGPAMPAFQPPHELASLSTQGSCSPLLGVLAVVGCRAPTANNSVCSCFRPARHLIPMGHPLRCSGGSLEGFPP